MPNKQQTFSQFATPPDVADLLLGFCLRRPIDRLLDPGCGAGDLLIRAAQWQKWLAVRQQDIPPNTLWGVELDEETAVATRNLLPLATILNQNFLTLSADTHPPFDAVIGNLPYTRAQWVARLNPNAARQMAFSWAEDPDESRPILPPTLTNQLDRRTGLHGYFLLHSTSFLREGGRMGLMVPNDWLDAAHGTALKQFILNHFKLLVVVESGIERWFSTAKGNICLLVLEKCAGPNRRAANRVRLVRLKRPLSHSLNHPLHDYRRVQQVESLITRLLSNRDVDTPDFTIGVKSQEHLLASERWGLMLRAPAAVQQRLEGNDLPTLTHWAIIQRGYTTGANRFFYLTDADVAKWGIESEFCQPVLKSLRGLAKLRLEPADSPHHLLVVPPTASLVGTAVADYIAWGEAEGFHQRQTCRARRPWYSLPAQPPAQLVFPKGIWRRHRTPLLAVPMPVDQQLYQIRLAVGVPLLAAAALLNSAWFMLHCELRGRANFSAGLLWLARYELADVPLPDPRRLPAQQVAGLAERFQALAQRPSLAIDEELSQPDRQALDTAVFDVLGLGEQERTAVVATLQERVKTRKNPLQPCQQRSAVTSKPLSSANFHA